MSVKQAFSVQNSDNKTVGLILVEVKVKFADSEPLENVRKVYLNVKDLLVLMSFVFLYTDTAHSNADFVRHFLIKAVRGLSQGTQCCKTGLSSLRYFIPPSL